ncbi:MAG: DUF429 domain-containing protein [Betaproteobacteria bacterium]|nr:DUF429 domain-containing protein [Betaproteobacteria bacterium]
MSATSFPYVGVDLTAGARPTDVAGLNEAGTSIRFERIGADAELLDLVADIGARAIAIDSPMGLPRGMCCLEEPCPCAPLDAGTGRSAERALAAMGVSCFWTTKRTIIKPMIYRAIALRDRLTAAGYATLEDAARGNPPAHRRSARSAARLPLARSLDPEPRSIGRPPLRDYGAAL